jgi:uncharacterized repeat protein (TIGR03803 family)
MNRFVRIVGMLISMLALQSAEAETVLYSFKGRKDGGKPYAGVIRDHAGNLYGTTITGGHYGTCRSVGCGVVYKLAPDGTETVLYAFNGGNDGGKPEGGLVMDGSGNLYGTTYEGGGKGCNNYGCGTIFKLSASGSETILHSFTGNGDGAQPFESLLLDRSGNLYGATMIGGNPACNSVGLGCGTVFKLAADGTFSTLYSFTGGADGDFPAAGVIMDRSGDLYGSAELGGDNICNCGTVFKIAPDSKMTILHTFTGSEGGHPVGTLVRDHAGNLFGTADDGHGIGCGGVGCGTVFKIARDRTFTVLHAFLGSDGGDGAFAAGSLIIDKASNLYGTTTTGGAGTGVCGTVFKVTPDGTETVLYSFQGLDGCRPESGVVEDKRGHLFGTTPGGGANNYGNVFELTP